MSYGIRCLWLSFSSQDILLRNNCATSSELIINPQSRFDDQFDGGKVDVFTLPEPIQTESPSLTPTLLCMYWYGAGGALSPRGVPIQKKLIFSAIVHKFLGSMRLPSNVCESPTWEVLWKIPMKFWGYLQK